MSSFEKRFFELLAVSLLYVFEELERQYDINIVTDRKEAAKQSYTGFFKKTNEPELSLDLICKSFDLNFVKQGDNTYKVSQN